MHVSFLPTYGDSALVMEHNYPQGEHNTVQISTLRFYISGVELYRQGTSVWKEEHSYHLLDMEVPGSMQLVLGVPSGLTYDAIKLQLGIDSITNVSGAMGGDLDPTKGMYWSWQSGFINFKLEGTSPACPRRKQEFQFHMGGYAGSSNSMQMVMLKTGNTDHVNIGVNIGQFLAGMDMATTNSMMIPGAEAVTLSRKAAGIFSIRP